MNIKTANRLYEFRKKHNLSQEELASKIGVSRQAVSKWERAEASPDTDNLILLAQIYGVTLDELLTDREEEKKKESSTQADKEDAGENTYTPNDNSCYKQAESVSFKNGIHVNAKNGDKVSIGFNGIHVDDHKGDSVHIDHNGVFVNEGSKQKVYTDSEGNVHYSEDLQGHIFNNEQKDKKKSIWHKFPYPILVVIVFLICGFAGYWYISWIAFLTIPLYYTLIDAVVKRNPNHFAYPVLVAAVYLFFGMTMCLWHPLWIIFLTIPIYYCITDIIKKK